MIRWAQPPNFPAPELENNQDFRGLNRGLRIADGEWAEETNMTGEYWPVASTRRPRSTDDYTVAKPGGLTYKDDKRIWVDGTRLMMEGEPLLDMGLSDVVPKQLVRMGAYLIIWPDRKYVNLADTGDHGSIDNKVSLAYPTVILTPLCNKQGKEYKNVTVSPQAPKEPVDGGYWLSTKDPENLKLKKWTAEEWVTIKPVFVKLHASGANAGFAAGDNVEIKGLTKGGPDDWLNGEHILTAVGSNYIVFEGITDQEGVSQKEPFTVERKAPEMDYIVESNNRLWGCFYGEREGKHLNEIYACALGDFKNWSKFQGVATDSYAVSRGSDGPWTGAATIASQPVFFKEDFIEKVYVSGQGAHQVVTTKARGVQEGCWRSLQTVGEILYYKARDGVVAYDGSMPYEVSGNLGSLIRYGNARAGVAGELYYIAMQHGAEWEMLVYDVVRQTWHREDATKPMMFATVDGALSWIDEDKGQLVQRSPITGGRETTVPWSVTTGDLGLHEPNGKRLGRMAIRADLDQGSDLMVLASYDGGPYQQLLRWDRPGLQSFVVPMPSHLYDHVRLRIQGNGFAKIYGIAKITERGGNLL